jgi:hypothetical protein
MTLAPELYPTIHNLVWFLFQLSAHIVIGFSIGVAVMVLIGRE